VSSIALKPGESRLFTYQHPSKHAVYDGESELLVRLGHARNNCISAHLRTLQHAKHDISRRLSLITDIMMPNTCTALLLEKLVDLFVIPIAINDMKPGKSRYRASDGLVIRLPKVVCELLLLRGTNVGKILVSKHDNFSLGYKEGKLVPLLRRERRKLETCNFGPHLWGDGCSNDPWKQQVAFRGVSSDTWIGEVERRHRFKEVGFPLGKILRISSTRLSHRRGACFDGDVDIVDFFIICA